MPETAIAEPTRPLMREQHGHRIGGASSEIQAFYDAKGRCTNTKHKRYKDWGGRGIQFRFASFAQFLAEIGTKPSSEHSLDRINNNGHYEPGNVRWATKLEQMHNRRGTIGSKHPMAKLTEDQVTVILQMLSHCSNTAIARQFQISHQLVWLIRHGHIWKHVKRSL